MNRRIRNRTYGGVEAEFGRLDSAIRYYLSFLSTQVQRKSNHLLR
jgi:hypothetical protein